VANITCDLKGRRAIQFSGGDGKRYTVGLGRMESRDAESVRRYIENLVECRLSSKAPHTSTTEWVTGLPDRIHARLVKAGLVAARQGKVACLTVAAWTREYIDGRTDLKRMTKANLGQCAGYLTAFFGPDRRLDEVTAGNAKDFRVFLKVDSKLGEGTVRRHLKRARQFFTAAIEHGLLTGKNPFTGIRCTDYADAGRFHFVTREEAKAVLDGCPSVAWRTIFALVRFGALRCPSEVMRLTVDDVDWERERFTVHASKTEDTAADGGTRDVPIFPELMPYLRAAFEAAEPGQTRLVALPPRENLRTTLTRIIKRAGVTPWPKVFVNCRATREIELAEKFPQHVVVKWLGHSESVARKHYLAVTENHFRRAADEPTVTPQRSAKVLRQVQESARSDSQEPETSEPTAERNPLNCQPLQEVAASCDTTGDTSTNLNGTPKGIRTPCLRAENPIS